MPPSEQMLGSRSPRPSHITLPPLAAPLPSLLDFLAAYFPRVGREVWQRRLRRGDIRDETGAVVSEATPYRVNARISYYREVESEPRIPFAEQILYEDEELLVADKPHFLPVTPSGRYVNECLLHRLMLRTGNGELVAVHRLDRETAGLVLFSKRKATRSSYFALFAKGYIEKHYRAVAGLPCEVGRTTWLVESRIERAAVRPLFANVPGQINARSRIELLDISGERARFALSPLTGKTHQLRLHMALIGAPILHDRFYPVLQPRREPGDYAQPLQLLASRLAFMDPVSGKRHRFVTQQRLAEWGAADGLG